MRWDYKRMREEIMPDIEVQNQIWENIRKKAGEKQKKGSRKRGTMWLVCGVAAAVFALVIFLPQTSLADGIKGFWGKYFYINADVEKDISHNVYEDTDGHVKMKIQDMLSDGACVYLDICYEALDSEGERWLSCQEFNTTNVRFAFVGDDFDQSTDLSCRVEEQKDLVTEKTRYFTCLYQDGSGNFNLKNVTRTLFYPMYQSQGIGEITIDCNMDIVCYRLEGDGSPSEYYEPEYLMVSKLSYGIFGKNKGAIISKKDKAGVVQTYYSKGFLSERKAGHKTNENDLPISFTMEDSSKMTMSQLEISKFTESIGVEEYDLRIAAGYFNTGDEFWNKNATIDPERLTGLDLDGVHYKLLPDM